MLKFIRARYCRRYYSIVIKWLLIAIIVWFIIFNAYAFHYKLDEFLVANRKLLAESHKNNRVKQQQQQVKYKNQQRPIAKQQQQQQHVKHDNMNQHHNQAISVQYIDEKTIEFTKRIQNINFKNAVKCESIIEFDLNEIKKAKQLIQKANLVNKFNPDENYVFEKSYCKLFRTVRGYDKHPIKESEYEFPLAYSILVYYNVEQFERLLKTIYRPQNLYCIHVDGKSSKKIHQAIASITQCFDNVFIASKLEHVIYGGISRLKADLNCMHDAYYSNFTYHAGKIVSPKWKYFINLASTEFPLRTNYELTRILRLYNGANDIEVLHEYPSERVKYSWITKLDNNQNRILVKTNSTKSAPPFNFEIKKGIAYGVFSREFVRFVLNDRHAKALLKWSEDTYSPDEYIWATLQSNTQFSPPGGYKAQPGHIVSSRARFIAWRGKYKCNGYFRHNICIFSAADIPLLLEKSDFFINKLQLEYDPIAYQCMEDWILDRILSNLSVNMVQYCRQAHLQAFINHTHCY